MIISLPTVLMIYMDGQIATKERPKAAFQLLDKPHPLSKNYSKVWEQGQIQDLKKGGGGAKINNCTCAKKFWPHPFNETMPTYCCKRDKQPEKSMDLDFFTLQTGF